MSLNDWITSSFTSLKLRFLKSRFFYSLRKLRCRWRLASSSLSQAKDNNDRLTELEIRCKSIDLEMFSSTHCASDTVYESNLQCQYQDIVDTYVTIWEYIQAIEYGIVINFVRSDYDEVDFLTYIDEHNGYHLDRKKEMKRLLESILVLIKMLRELQSSSRHSDRRNLAIMNDTVDGLLSLLRRLNSFQT